MSFTCEIGQMAVYFHCTVPSTVLCFSYPVLNLIKKIVGCTGSAVSSFADACPGKDAWHWFFLQAV